MDVTQFETGKIVFVQAAVHEGIRDALVELTGEANRKDAIVKAIYQFIENQEKSKNERTTMEKK